MKCPFPSQAQPHEQGLAAWFLAGHRVGVLFQGGGAVSAATMERDEEEASVLFFSSGLHPCLEETQREVGKYQRKKKRNGGWEWRMVHGMAREEESEWLLLGRGRSSVPVWAWTLASRQQAAANTAAVSPS